MENAGAPRSQIPRREQNRTQRRQRRRLCPQDARSQRHAHRTGCFRLRDLFGPNYVVSPSHESILPGVTIENVLAMAEAAAE